MFYKETYKGYSPWGGIQDSFIYGRGLKLVCTPGHGGYMVTKKFADKYLSDSCKKRGTIYKNYLCYEEDSQYCILAYDIADKFGEKMKSDKHTLEEYKNSLLEVLSLYYPDYLFEIGVKPMEKPYQLYLENKKIDEMRKNKDSDLIISASMAGNRIVKVVTADDKVYFVTKESYSNLRNNSKLLLLSKCNKVDFKEEI